MKCDGCGKTIRAPFGSVEIIGKRWHKKCFKCKSCGLQLNVKSCKVHIEDVFCIAHFQQQLLLARNAPAIPQPTTGAVRESTYAELMPEWYHGDLSREDAESRLHNDGDFLVRASQKQGGYILSVKWEAKFHHFHPIPCDPEIPSIREYIDRQLRSGHPFSDLSTAILKTPVSQTRPIVSSGPGAFSSPTDDSAVYMDMSRRETSRPGAFSSPTHDSAEYMDMSRPQQVSPATKHDRTSDTSDVVKMTLGSVCEQQVDAIVNSTNYLLDLKTGALSNAILTGAGQQMQKELNRLARLSAVSADNCLIVTKGYKLPCQYVLHVVFPKRNASTVAALQGLVKSIFTNLQEMKLTSVAIPPIGTGGFGYQANVVAKILCEEAANHLETTPQPTLTDIRFVVRPDDKANQDAFRQALAPDGKDNDYVEVSNEVLHAAASTFCKKNREVGEFRSRHQSLTFAKLPENWSALESDISHRKIELDRTSMEYQRVVMSMSKDDRDTFENLIYKIERVESPALYKFYEFSKLQMSRRTSASRRPADANLDRNLWHGTDQTALDGICQYGFNRSYCGKNGYVFGKGVYFAREFAYSAEDRYSKPDKSGLKCVLRCRVLTGQFTVGMEDMIEPPPKPGSSTERFDSTADDDSNPTVFVIYNDYHAYPQYIVTFFSNIQVP